MSTTDNFIYFDTLGCAKNLCDTSDMAERLRLKGYCITEDPQKANLIILNTCAFIEASAQESIDTFFEYKNTFDVPIIVTGCLVSRYGEELKAALKETDIFVACNDEINIVDIVGEYLTSNKEIEKADSANIYEYVKISEGCDRFCSYCTIPYIRGRYKSYPYDDIKFQCDAYIQRGAKEIILVAQDCGEWGSDLDNKNLSWLLGHLANDFESTLFRVLYIQPENLNSELINTIKKYDNIANYFDIPIQHSSEKILKSMNRQALNLPDIKKIIPDARLRTTLIVGYPGETEEDFDNLCEYISKSDFDFVGVFKYSKEEGTEASTLNCQVDEKIKDERFSILRDICDQKSFDSINDKIGNIYKITIEGYEDGRFYGRNQYLAPEVDGYIFVETAKNIHLGDSFSVKIIDTELYDLVGEIVEMD